MVASWQVQVERTHPPVSALVYGKSVVLSEEFHMMPLPVEQNVQWTRASEILTDTDPR